MGFFETLKNKRAAKKAGLTYEQYLEFLAMAAEKGYSLDDYRTHLKAGECNMTDEQYREYIRDFSALQPEEYLHFNKARSEGLSVRAYDVYLSEYQQFMSAGQYGDYLKIGESYMSIEEYMAYLKNNPQSNADALELYITTQKAHKLNMTVSQYREYTTKFSSNLNAKQYLMFRDARSIGLSLEQFLKYWRSYRDIYTLERYYQYCQAQKEKLSLDQYDEWKKDYSSLSAVRFRNLLEARKQNMTLEAYEELQSALQLGITVEQYRENQLADFLGIRVEDLPFYRTCKENQENGKNFAIVSSWNEVKIANKIRIKKIILVAEKFKTIPDRVFWGCDAFQEIILPWGIQEIGQYAFSNCTSLETITIPGSVKSLPRGVFDGCEALRVIELLSGIEKVDITGWADLPALRTVASAGTISEFEIDKTSNYHNFSRNHWNNDQRGYDYDFNHSKNYGVESVILNHVRNSVEILELEDERSIRSLENFPNLKVLILGTKYLEIYGLNQIKNCPRLHTIIINGADQTDYYTKSGSVRKRIEYKKELHISAEGIMNQLKFLIIKSNLLSISGGMIKGADGKYQDIIYSHLSWLHIPSETERVSLSAPNLTEIGVSSSCYVRCDSVKRLLINEFVYKTSDILTVLATDISDTGKIREKLFVYRLDNTYSNCRFLNCKDLVIYEGATKIPKDFFCNGRFETVSLPLSIEAIESKAFAWCENLKHIALKKIPERIADDAFYNCNAIEEVTGVSLLEAKMRMNLPHLSLRKVKNIDFTYFSAVISQSLFTGCAITELVIPAKIKTIESRAFADIKTLTSITFSGTMKMIASDSFEGCVSVKEVMWKKPDLFRLAGTSGFPNVENIVLPKGTQKIPESCFAKWGLCEIVIPESVTIIESRAFADCKNLRSVTFKGKPEQIAEDAFEGCTSVETIEWGDSRNFCIAGKTGFPNIKHLSIPEGVTEIPDKCFKNWGIQVIIIPQTVVSIGKKAFEGCPISTINGENGILRLTEHCQIAPDSFAQCMFKTIVFDVPEPNKFIKIAESVGATEIVVRDTVGIDFFNQILTIPNLISVSCIKTSDMILVSTDELQAIPTTLRSLELPRSVGKLDFAIFNDSKALRMLTIPESVEHVLSEVNLQKMKLQEITVPADMYHIILKEWINPDTQVNLLGEAHPEKYEVIAVGKDAHLPKLNSKDRLLVQKLIIPECCISIAEAAFENLANLRIVEIKAPIQSVGPRAFCGCIHLKQIALPDSVDRVGEAAFLGCTSLTQVQLSQTLTQIETKVFSQCAELQKIELPSTISIIGEGAFEGCECLHVLTIPDQLCELGAFAFAGSGLRKVHIPDGIKRLHKGIFKDCAQLTTMTGMQNVSYIDEDAFSGSAMTDLVFSEEIFSINNAFRKCKALERIFVPVNIAKFCVDLTGCTSMRDLYLPQQIDDFSCETSNGNAITVHARRGSAWRQKIRVLVVDYIKNNEYDEMIRIELEKAGLSRCETAVLEPVAGQMTEKAGKRVTGSTAQRRASWNTKINVTTTEVAFASGPATVDELVEKLQSSTEQVPYVIESVECNSTAILTRPSAAVANIYVAEEAKTISNNIFTITLKHREMPYPSELFVVLADKNGKPVSDMKKVKIAQEQCETIGVQLQLNKGTPNGEYFLITALQANIENAILSADKCFVDVAFAVDMDFEF